MDGTIFVLVVGLLPVRIVYACDQSNGIVIIHIHNIITIDYDNTDAIVFVNTYDVRD
jgi:hypothetical protein